MEARLSDPWLDLSYEDVGFQVPMDLLDSYEDTMNQFSTGSNTGLPTNVLRNCSRLSKYLMLNVLFGNLAYTGRDESSLASLYNGELDAFLRTEYSLNDMTEYFIDSIPRMGIFGEDGKGLAALMPIRDMGFGSSDYDYQSYEAVAKLANLSLNSNSIFIQ
jgi:hypothetical protein